MLFLLSDLCQATFYMWRSWDLLWNRQTIVCKCNKKDWQRECIEAWHPVYNKSMRTYESISTNYKIKLINTHHMFSCDENYLWSRHIICHLNPRYTTTGRWQHASVYEMGLYLLYICVFVWGRKAKQSEWGIMCVLWSPISHGFCTAIEQL